ncbi:uncharacterized protein LOC130367547 isoform X2 [Hyla sarda]|nr:uncharacterized protein LOC130367547 isoform X2 [Hyla sarda]
MRRSPGGTWTSRMKKGLVTITGAIPPVGGVPIGKIIGFLLNLFWPESQPDIWSLIKDQVEGLIDEKILEFELQERRNEIRAIQKTMRSYVDARIREKGSWISTLIHACNELFYKLTQSKNSMQFIPLVVTHSTLHLLILKERLLHGKEMYVEDNTEVWRKELEDQISSYKDFIKDIYAKWVEWRKSKINVKVGASFNTFMRFRWVQYVEIYDEMGKDSVKYYDPFSSGPYVPDHFRPICEGVKRKIFGFRNGEMLQILVPTFYLDNFIPGNEDNPSVIPSAMSIASFGPISPQLDGGDESSRLYSPDDDNTGGGDVTSINVRQDHFFYLSEEWSFIESFQVFYSTGAGSIYGGSSGAKLHKIPLDNRRVKSIQFCYDDSKQAEVTIRFSDGNSTGPMGIRAWGPLRCVNTGGIDTYGLYNIRAADNKHLINSYTKRAFFQIELDYKAYPVRPSELHN